MKYSNKLKQFDLKLFLLIIAVLLPWNFTKAQEFNFVQRIPFTGQSYTTDNFGNLLIASNGDVVKYDLNGVQTAIYSSRDAGNVHSIDATDPLKVIVFYKDFGIVRVLDQWLAIKSEINLRDIGLKEPWLVCNSGSNGYWIFDQSDFQLKKVNNQLSIISESLPINRLFKNVNPNFLIETANFVLLNLPDKGILVFDNFGIYSRTIDIKELKYFQPREYEIFYAQNDTIISCNLYTLEREEIVLPSTKDILDMRAEPHRMYLRRKDAIDIYSF
ncbi:MAG TPA: hypothetical protein PKM16_00810 [Bacteroidia bacterium]|nr:hypothetical protein [Bacteroidia bacterium]